jgi:hypothetical protein
MHGLHYFVFKGEQTPIMFTTTSMRMLEKTLNMSLQTITYRMLKELYGIGEMSTTIWAGLEGARLKLKVRPQPWTQEEVDDMIDELGGVPLFFQKDSPVIKAMTEAWSDAFPAPEKKPNTTADGATLPKAGKKKGKKNPPVARS